MSAVCANCGFNNPPGMRFCGQCGTRLAEPAARPASVFSPEQLGVMMGPDLLERFRRAGLEAAGQRRVVTVLFADLAGYTDLSEKMDAEDLYTLIQRLIGTLANDVYKYEGTVDKFTGDGLMALFGAPIAHENGAELAVRSACDMLAGVARFGEEARQALGVDLGLHVGLHTGPVIVGSVGSSMLMNYTAIGDTVNLARRLQEASTPGTILVSEAVYQQTRALFDYETIPPLTLKGINRPVPGFQFLGPRDEPGAVRGLAGLRAPMIGRDGELGQLAGYVTDLVENRQGRLVLVTGEAGLGKSRLMTELRARTAEAPVQVIEGHSLTYRRSAAYWIFIDALRNYLGVTPYTPPEQVQTRLAARVGEALGPLAAEALPYLEHLLSLRSANVQAAARVQALEAGRLRQQTFLAVRELLVAEAARRPLVLVLEDLHWADEVSLDLLLSLVDSLAQAPLLICGVSRPVLDGPLAATVERAQKRLGERLVHIPLQSLSPGQSEVLLLELMSGPSLPAELREQILPRAAGVPFFLEEILRMLIDANVLRLVDGGWQVAAHADVGELGVPDTLQGLILARFDRLEEAERRVLQAASVIGRQFSRDMLLAVTGQPNGAVGLDEARVDNALAVLSKREFVVPLLQAVAEEYQFKHALVSDAIYSTLLRRDRSELHGQVGDAIEQVYAGRLDEHVEVLARHYAWSPRQDRALHYLILAGQQAARGHAVEQARRHFDQALALLPGVPHGLAQALQVRSGLGDVLVFIGEYEGAREHYRLALETVAGNSDPASTTWLAHERAGLQRKLSRTYERQGQHEDALVCLAAAQQALVGAADVLPVEKANILQDIGWIHFRHGDFAEAQQLLQAALALVEGTEAFDVIASIYNRLGGLAHSQGDWTECASYVRKSIAIRESIADVVTLADSFNNLGVLEIEMGQFDSALENLNRCYMLKRRQGQADGIAIALNNLGLLRIRRGELAEARVALNDALEITRQIGYTSLLGSILMHFGELYLAGHEWDLARSVLGQGADLFRELGSPDQTIEMYRLLGETALAVENVAEAARWQERVESVSASLGARTARLPAIQRGEALRFRGRLALYQGDWAAAQRHLRGSNEIYRELGNRLYLGRIAYDFGLLALRQGEANRAQMHFREAGLLFRSVGARLDAQRADEALSWPSRHKPAS